MKFWKNHLCRQLVFLYFINVMEKGNSNQVRQIELEIIYYFYGLGLHSKLSDQAFY